MECEVIFVGDSGTLLMNNGTKPFQNVQSLAFEK